MGRNQFTVMTLFACILVGSAVYFLTNKQTHNAQDAGTITQLVHLGTPPSLQQAQAWDIPVEPQKGQREKHTHLALRIYWDGASWPVPARLGYAQNGQTLAIHTHAADGVVHLHLPAGHKPFTLQQILDLWGLKTDGMSITVWKDGHAWQDGLGQPIPDLADIV